MSSKNNDTSLATLLGKLGKKRQRDRDKKVSPPSQMLTMKIREKNIRDRWLINIRKDDYSLYLLSGFLLLSSKDSLKYSKKMLMDQKVIDELKILTTFIEYFFH